MGADKILCWLPNHFHQHKELPRHSHILEWKCRNIHTNVQHWREHHIWWNQSIFNRTFQRTRSKISCAVLPSHPTSLVYWKKTKKDIQITSLITTKQMAVTEHRWFTEFHTCVSHKLNYLNIFTEIIINLSIFPTNNYLWNNEPL